MKKLLAVSAAAAMTLGLLALAAPASAASATCVSSNYSPAPGEQFTISAAGLRGGGQTHLYVDELTDTNTTTDLGSIGSVDTYSFNWASPTGATVTVRFTNASGSVLKCSVQVQVDPF